MHFPEAAAYCIDCRLRREVCLCHSLQRVDSDINLLLVLHEDEARKMSNTGHLARLVLNGSHLIIRPARDRSRMPVDLSLLSEPADSSGRPWRTLLLSPDAHAQLLSPEAVAELVCPDTNGIKPHIRLVVPDGTWSQARRMIKRIPELAVLPRVRLPMLASFQSREELRPRGNPEPARVSTCEAIAAAYAVFGDAAAAAALYDVYDAAALRIALMRGKLKQAPYQHLLVGSASPVTAAVTAAPGSRRPL